MAIVKLLFEKGADVNAKDTTDDTITLWRASDNGHTEVVKLLLENGADVNVKRTDVERSNCAVDIICRLRKVISVQQFLMPARN